MERSPGPEVPDTTSRLEEPISLPGVDLRCGSRTSRSRSRSLSSSDPPALTRDTLVCREATEALTNGANLSRATIKDISNQDTTTTTQHTIRANIRNNKFLLPLTEALDKIPMLTSSRFSFLTFPSNHNYQNQPNAHLFPARPPLPLPCSCNQPTIFSLVFSGALTALTWYFFLVVCQNVHSIWTV